MITFLFLKEQTVFDLFCHYLLTILSFQGNMGQDNHSLIDHLIACTEYHY